jgi:methyl-accepting chemotaxis protein
MHPTLTSPSLTLTLLAAGQGGLVAGLAAGWDPVLTGSVSVAGSVAAAWTVWGAASARKSMQSEVGQHVQRLATGDLTQEVVVHGDANTQQVLGALQKLQTALRRALETIRGGAEGVAVAASEIATGNANLSSRTEQTSSSLQQAAGAMQELTGTVNQTAESARTANQLASSASEVAQRGGSVVSQVVATMEDINTSSKKISDIIGTIDGIAFQTNILALNAAVEAARAGEQGRGFAVVAGEVRSLAQRSAEAAREIKGLINSSVEKVQSGSRLVTDAGHTMTEIVDSVQRVTDIMGEISAAAAEQSSGIGQVSQAVAELDRMTQQNAALVEESAAAAQSLKDQSDQLTAAMAGFRFNGSNPPASTLAKPTAVASHAISKARQTSTHSKTSRTEAAAQPPNGAGQPDNAKQGAEEWESF